MDKYGHIHPREPDRGTQIEPIHGHIGGQSLRLVKSSSEIPMGHQDKTGSQGPAPSAPPMPRARAKSREEVNSNKKEVVLYSFKVSRIHIDSHYVALYADALGVFYKSVIYHGKTYPQDMVVYALGCKGAIQVTLLDEWGKSYHRGQEESLGQYTFQGHPVFYRRMHPAIPFPKLADTTRPQEPILRAPTPRHGISLQN